MHITDLPKETLCHILSFLRFDSYFNAISSNIFPIDIKQYNDNKFAEQEKINERERCYRIKQGRMLIQSFVKEHALYLQRIVNENIDDWDDEIDEYFLYNEHNNENENNNEVVPTIITTILNYATSGEN